MWQIVMDQEVQKAQPTDSASEADPKYWSLDGV